MSLIHFKVLLQDQNIPIINGPETTHFNIDSLHKTTTLNQYRSNTKTGAIQLELDTIDLTNNIYEEVFGKNVKLFEVNRTKISGLEIYNCRFYFLQDSLYKIECLSSRELSDALKLKFGKPQLKVKTDKVYCRYKLTGVVSTKKIEVFTETWTSAPGIVASQSTGNKFDENCKEFSFSQLTIKNQKGETLAKNDSRKRKAEFVKMMQLSKRSSLEEL